MTGGVCNYCLNWRPNAEPRGEDQLRALVDRLRSRGGKYDCAVALSGGRDSTFVLHYAVRRLGLKVLAFTVDNGYMPNETVQNIRAAVDILGVHHVMVKYEHLRKSLRPVFSAWLRRPSAAMVAQMCLGCRLAFVKGCMKVSRTSGLRLCLSGYGEPGISFATAFLARGSTKAMRASTFLCNFAAELIRNPRYLLPPSVPLRIVREAMALILPTHFFPHVKALSHLTRPAWSYVSLFDYIPWDEDDIMTTITRELRWKKYGHSATPWRADCKINLLKNAMYLRTVGFSKNDDMLSDLIRRGGLSRQDALARLEIDNHVPTEFLREICDEIGVDFAAFARL